MLKQSFHLTFGIVALVMVTTVSAKLPEHVYACHVVTESKSDGIVLIQTNNIEEAYTEALHSKNRTIKNTKAKIIQVKECVERPKGKFSDYAIQKMYENMAM